MSERVHLAERHVIKQSDPRFAVIDRAAFASKNLYNLANYYVRQTFIHEGKYLNNAAVYHLVKESDAYKALPRKVSQLVLIQLHRNWKGFFGALSAWKENPEKFLGRPKLPKYKDKQKGRNLLIYNPQAFSRRKLQKGIIQPSGLAIEVKTEQRNVNEVRIVPRNGHYVVEVVYAVDIECNPNLDETIVAGIDIGLNNLATLTANKPGFQPLIVNGHPLKSVNQYYNKRKAELQSQLPDNRQTSKQIAKLSQKRNRKVNHFLHNASRQLIDHLLNERVGVLVIGQNKNWKQAINLGKQTNQNFVAIPHARFIEMLSYKAKLAGIQVIITEESYTSKCSFLDLEPIGKHQHYVGKRVKRGFFRASCGRHINADVNGSYNIIRKAVPNAFHGKGIEDFVVHPLGFQPING